MKIIDRFIENERCQGVYNVCSPQPIPQKDLMKILRVTIGGWAEVIGLPATKWMAEIGAFFMRTDTELVLKSRRVIPQRLLNEGFTFSYPDRTNAVSDLVAKRTQLQKKKITHTSISSQSSSSKIT